MDRQNCALGRGQTGFNSAQSRPNNEPEQYHEKATTLDQINDQSRRRVQGPDALGTRRTPGRVHRAAARRGGAQQSYARSFACMDDAADQRLIPHPPQKSFKSYA